jgi:hypothetical protein
MDDDLGFGDAFGDGLADGLHEEIAEIFAALGSGPDFADFACLAPHRIDRQQRTEQREARELRAEWSRTLSRHTEAKSRTCRTCSGPITALPKRGPVPGYCSPRCASAVRNLGKRVRRAAVKITAPADLPIAA